MPPKPLNINNFSTDGIIGRHKKKVPFCGVFKAGHCRSLDHDHLTTGALRRGPLLAVACSGWLGGYA